MKKKEPEPPPTTSEPLQNALAKPMQEFGSKLIQSAKANIENKHRDKLVNSAAWLVEQKAVFEAQITTLTAAVDYITRKLAAIEGGEFKLVHGHVIFDEDEFNHAHREYFGDRSEWSVG